MANYNTPTSEHSPILFTGPDEEDGSVFLVWDGEMDINDFGAWIGGWYVPVGPVAAIDVWYDDDDIRQLLVDGWTFRSLKNI
jgi:hypothetical protein